MNKIAYKISSGVASAALLALSIAPAAFASEVTVAGNGAFSDNTVKLNNSSRTNVAQTNDTNIRNNVNTNQNTGGNNASFNTGGSTNINTGNASSEVSISNEAGANFLSLGCGCNNQSTDVFLGGNGAFSLNKVKVNNNNTTTVRQTNNTNLNNQVNTRQNTGNNSASFNTGGMSYWGWDMNSDPSITTGNTWSGVHLDNHAGMNSLMLH